MRGILRLIMIQKLMGRFNPAYAGNIETFKRGCKISKVQPRVCGEYHVFDMRYQLAIGSTPRMRGISTAARYCRQLIRFNPAYAGNMVIMSSLPHGSQVQPRVCGEYMDRGVAHENVIGSTPRMRGILAVYNVVN